MSNYKDPKDSNQPKNDETIHRSRTKNKKSKSGLSGKLSLKHEKNAAKKAQKQQQPQYREKLLSRKPIRKKS